MANCAISTSAVRRSLVLCAVKKFFFSLIAKILKIKDIAYFVETCCFNGSVDGIEARWQEV